MKMKVLRLLPLGSALLLFGAGSALAQGSFILGQDDWTDHGEIGALGGPGTGVTVAEGEPNDDHLTANPMAIGDDYTGSIDNLGVDEDYASFTAAAGDSIVATTVSGGTLVDTKLWLYDTDGVTQLAYNDDIDWPANPLSQITYTFANPGTYFLKVGSYSTSEGTYICELRMVVDVQALSGWEYIQHALEAIAGGVTRAGNDGSVAVLGSADSAATEFDAGGAYHHVVPLAAANSSLSGVVTFHDGDTAINTFFTDLANATVNPQIIVIAGSGSGNDLDSLEGAALTANAAAIGGYVSSGGGLLSHGDDYSAGISYGWLSTLLPGASVTLGDNLPALTGQGHFSLTGVTDQLIASGAHGHFSGHGLDVFATAPGSLSPGPWSGVTIAESEPNDDALNPDPLAVGDDYAGSIDAAGADIDYASFTVLAGDAVHFETVSGGTLSDTRLFLYDTDGVTQLAFDDDGGPLYLSIIDYTFAAAGTYFIAVDSFGIGTGTYSLQVRTLVPGADLDVVIGSIPSAWDYLGHSLAGVNGDPLLVGSGPLTPSSAFAISLTNAAQATTAYLVIGLSQLNAPFKGGVLVPSVFQIIPLPTNASGELSFGGTLSAGAPSGVSLYFQYWIVDGLGPLGFSASNGMSGTTP